MLKKDIVIGATYIVKVSGHLVPVRIDRPSEYGGWYGTSLRSGREIRIRSAQKLRRQASDLDIAAATN